MRYLYPLDLEADPEGGFVVTCPDLPEVVTQGDDRTQALTAADDAVEEALAGRLAAAICGIDGAVASGGQSAPALTPFAPAETKRARP